MQTLTSQTAIVTGAGAGIGRGIALVLASEGASVVTVDIDGDRAAATVRRIEDAGGTAIALTADVAVTDGVRRLVDAAMAWTGRVDVLASNVGIYPTSAIESTSEEIWDHVMTVNVKSAFLLLKAVLPIMRAQHYGRVIVTSSITGPITAMPTLAHYAASKAALMGLVRSAALESASDGITVNAVLPGTVDTDGLRAAGGQEYVDLMLPSIPAGRLAQPQDLGWAVRLLAAPEAGYVTGVGLPVDGGQTLPEGRISADAMDAIVAVGV
jgi:3-oxoacyl-[acyl-carrier protein] reductase